MHTHTLRLVSNEKQYKTSIIMFPLWLGGIRIQPTFALVRVERGD